MFTLPCQYSIALCCGNKYFMRLKNKTEQGMTAHYSLYSFFVHMQMAKLAKMKTPPSEMFRSETDKYSAFDDTVRLFSLLLLIHVYYS